MEEFTQIQWVAGLWTWYQDLYNTILTLIILNVYTREVLNIMLEVGCDSVDGGSVLVWGGIAHNFEIHVIIVMRYYYWSLLCQKKISIELCLKKGLWKALKHALNALQGLLL